MRNSNHYSLNLTPTARLESDIMCRGLDANIEIRHQNNSFDKSPVGRILGVIGQVIKYLFIKF